MKMETVIRSPQNGLIKKLAHKEGVCKPDESVIHMPYANDMLKDICKAGTILVLFEEATESSET
jgi:3-methylcrotonyl-CoA carboxylase alpha subunit